MTKSEKILLIQKEMADKKLSLGCVLKDSFREYYIGDEGRIYAFDGILILAEMKKYRK